MKASFKARYEANKDKTPPSAVASAVAVNFNAGDLKLRASLTDATFIHGPSLNGLAFALEKPGSFVFDYDVPKQDVRFQFMNSVKVAQKPLNLTYMHSKYVGKPPSIDNGENAENTKPTVNLGRTVLNGTLVLDSANKVSANHVLGSGNVKLKYTYVHGGLTTFEPSCDLKTQTWDFAVTRRVFGDDLLKASYQPTNKNLGLEWTSNSKVHGSFKIAATFDLREDLGIPKLAAETTWNVEM